MRALVTGGAGFIGSNLVDRLLAEGHEVDVVDDLSTGSLANLSAARVSGGSLRFHNLDVRSSDFVDLVGHRRPEVIFHLAAQADVRVSVERPVFDAEVNILGTLQVLEGRAPQAPRRSSSPLRAALCTASRTNPGCPWTSTSRTGRSRPTASRRRRASTISSPTGSCTASSSPLSPSPTSTGRDRTRTERPGWWRSSPATWSPGVNVSSTVTANRHVTTSLSTTSSTPLLVPHGRGDGLVLNIGTGKETSVLALYEIVARASASGLAPRMAAARPGELQRSSLDPRRAGLHLGWKPWTPLEDGVSAVVKHISRDRS